MRFHNKYHNKNHHTDPTSGYPDSARDPIASEDNPFKGDFHLEGNQFVNDNIYLSKNLILSGGNISQVGNISSENISSDNIQVSDTAIIENLQTNSASINELTLTTLIQTQPFVSVISTELSSTNLYSDFAEIGSIAAQSVNFIEGTISNIETNNLQAIKITSGNTEADLTDTINILLNIAEWDYDFGDEQTIYPISITGLFSDEDDIELLLSSVEEFSVAEAARIGRDNSNISAFEPQEQIGTSHYLNIFGLEYIPLSVIQTGSFNDPPSPAELEEIEINYYPALSPILTSDEIEGHIYNLIKLYDVFDRKVYDAEDHSLYIAAINGVYQINDVDGYQILTIRQVDGGFVNFATFTPIADIDDDISYTNIDSIALTSQELEDVVNDVNSRFNTLVDDVNAKIESIDGEIVDRYNTEIDEIKNKVDLIMNALKTHGLISDS